MQDLEKHPVISEIFKTFQPLGLLTECLGGDASKKILNFSAVETAGEQDLVFVDKVEYLEILKLKKPACVVVSEKNKALFSELKDTTLLVTPYVPLAHAHIRQRYAGRDYSESGWAQVHASAVIHETARLHPTVVVEPRAVIGARVQIGKNSRIMAGAVVENDVIIGDDTILQPNCVVGYKCLLGNQVLIGPGSIVGSEGFGFAQDAKRKSYPIPQTGIVVIEDRVRLGANNCIDRAAFQETRIGAGTKLDNLCHVAHNVQIGEDCLLTAMLCMAGSTKLGNRVMTSGQTGILDHLNICDDTIFLHRAGVSKDVETPGAYAGLPLLPLQEYMKNAVVMKNAVELKQRVRDLEKKMEKNQSSKEP